jgi:hypothetical protein
LVLNHYFFEVFSGVLSSGLVEVFFTLGGKCFFLNFFRFGGEAFSSDVVFGDDEYVDSFSDELAVFWSSGCLEEFDEAMMIVGFF